ncbi:MAG: response regulator [Gemmatimonadetes bacterium]|nr:response regulator [Gemmatimonadota bacterium]NIO31905.1 response regulator [Gemmatimonadota bacterium]
MEKYLSTGTVARICQVSPMTIAKWIDEGSLPGHTTPGGHRRVAASDLVRFLERIGMHVPSSLRQNSRLRVLVVHRDPEDLGRLAEAFLAASDRYEFRGTTRGVDALLLVGEWRPRVVLLDLSLEDVDGVQICRRFCELAGDHHIEIIALTPQLDGSADGAALEAGAAMCIPRDAPPARVLDFLDGMLAREQGGNNAVTSSRRLDDCTTEE